MNPLLAWCFAATRRTVGSACGQEPLFVSAPESPIPVAGGPGNAALGDINKDGIPDLIVVKGKASG